MTEKEFEARVEATADRFENAVEHAADRFDRSVTRTYRRNRYFFYALNLIIATGLILCFFLVPGTWGTVLGILGVAALAGHVLQRVFLRA